VEATANVSARLTNVEALLRPPSYSQFLDTWKGGFTNLSSLSGLLVKSDADLAVSQAKAWRNAAVHGEAGSAPSNTSLSEPPPAQPVGTKPQRRFRHVVPRKRRRDAATDRLPENSPKNNLTKHESHSRSWRSTQLGTISQDHGQLPKTFLKLSP
jgi:hypothetical protein